MIRILAKGGVNEQEYVGSQIQEDEVYSEKTLWVYEEASMNGHTGRISQKNKGLLCFLKIVNIMIGYKENVESIFTHHISQDGRDISHQVDWGERERNLSFVCCRFIRARGLSLVCSLVCKWQAFPFLSLFLSYFLQEDESVQYYLEV